MNYHASREAEIQSRSQEVLDKIPEGAKDSAAMSRTTLFSWLVKMDADLRSPQALATDELADFAINQLQAMLTKIKADSTGDDTRVKKAIAAIEGLSDDEALNAFRYMLTQVLVRMGVTTRLFSQNLSDGRWEETGFFVDDAQGFVAAAVAGSVAESNGAISRTPYQPIGYLNGEHYVPTESSKLLWARKFALGAMIPYAGAFKVEAKEIQGDSPDAPWNRRQILKATELIETLETDLKEYGDLGAEEHSKERLEKSDAMVTAIEIASLSLPALDQLLNTIKEEHPEVGDRFQNANVVDFALAINQFLRERVAAAEALIHQDSTELVVEPVDPKQLPAQLLRAVESVLVGGAPEHDRADAVIRQYLAAYPEGVEKVRVLTDAGCETSEILQAIAESLGKLVNPTSEITGA